MLLGRYRSITRRPASLLTAPAQVQNPVSAWANPSCDEDTENNRVIVSQADPKTMEWFCVGLGLGFVLQRIPLSFLPNGSEQDSIPALCVFTGTFSWKPTYFAAPPHPLSGRGLSWRPGEASMRRGGLFILRAGPRPRVRAGRCQDHLKLSVESQFSLLHRLLIWPSPDWAWGLPHLGRAGPAGEALSKC